MLKAPLWVRCIQWILTGMIVIYSVISLYPLLWIVMTSFKTYAESIRWPPTFLPERFLLDNFRVVFTTPLFLRYFFNSTVYAVVGTAASVLISAMGGYAFAKFDFKAKRLMFILVLSTIMIPGQVTLVPVFLIVSNLGWVNTFMGLIIPNVVSVFGIFLVRQFAMGVSNDYLDAARVDGSGETRIFFAIFIPLIMPVILTLIVLDFMGRWNDLFWPLIIASGRQMMTLQLALTSLFRTIYDTRWNELSAAMCIAAFPVLALYVLFQKQFTRGIVLTSGIKG